MKLIGKIVFGAIALLLERYHRLSEMTNYAITLTPDYRAPIPNYAGLGKVHRLNSLAIAALVIDDSDNLERLREVIDKQRFSFADAATLIEKMVIVSMLHFDLKLYAGLLKLPGIAARHEPFPALDAEERTLRRAYIHEFAIGASLLDNGSWGAGISAFEKFLVGLYFKPRKLENHAYEHTWMRLLALESRPLAERQSPLRGSSYSWWEGYTDPIGYIMYEISRPSFNYHDRIEHLDGLITLVNSAAEIHRKSLRGDAIADYLSTVDTRARHSYAGATLEYDGFSKALFFEIPGFESSNNTRTQDLPPRVELN